MLHNHDDLAALEAITESPVKCRLPESPDLTGIVSRWFHAGSISNGVSGGPALTWGGIERWAYDSFMQLRVPQLYQSYFSFTPTGFPAGAAPGTIAGWIRADAGSAGALMDYGSSVANQARRVFINGSGLVVGDCYWNTFCTSAQRAIYCGWRHLAMTYDGSTAYLYINGYRVGGAAVACNTGLTWGWIGSTNGGGENLLTGQLADIRVYNVAKTMAQLKAIARLEA